MLVATLILFSQCALAETVKGLYTVTLPVASQSDSALKNATKEGLKTVFVRVSGSERVLAQDQIASAISRANIYMKQFRYERSRNLETDTPELLVSLEFEAEQVDKILRDAGLPIWASNRPSVLVWIVVDDRRGKHFASSESDPELINAITKHATRRGLPLKLPSLDLEDNLSVTPEQLWQLDNEKALSISERYNVDTILVGRITHLNNGQWLGTWAYQYNKRNTGFDGDARSIDEYIGAGINQVADLLAADYAFTPLNTNGGGWLMRLTGVNDFSDYARAINYLESVAAIRYANVVDIQDDSIIVRIKADGLIEQLQQSFALDRRLLPSEAPPYQGNYVISLDYQWPGSRY